jgi:uncharacterized membrane protein YczE
MRAVIATAAAPADVPVPASRWRASPARLARLLVGLVMFGVGEALLVASALGNSPWTVFAEGAALQTGVGVGVATVVLSFVVLLAWVPLRQRPGLGTILNAVVVGLAMEPVLALVEQPHGIVARAALVAGGIALVAVGSAIYLTTFLGPGPRDGLMTGLHRRTGRPIGALRMGIEAAVLVAGWALGGTVGIGTLAFALTIGPAVAALLALTARGSLADL